MEHWLEQELNQLEALSPSELAQHPASAPVLQDSCYDLHLQRWAEHLPDNPPLLIASERLFMDPAPELKRVLKFIGSSQQQSRGSSSGGLSTSIPTKRPRWRNPCPQG